MTEPTPEALRATADRGQRGPVEPTGPLLDAAVLDRLVADLGEVQVVADIVEVYLAQLPQRTDGLCAAVDAGDVSALSRAAHTLTAASRAVGGESIGRLSATVEAASTLEVALLSARALLAVVDRFAAELRGWLAEHRPLTDT